MTNRTGWLPAATAAVGSAAVGVLWWVAPDAYPFGSADRVTVSLTHLIEYRAAAVMMLVAGGLGLVFAALGAVRSRIAVVGAGLEAAFLALVMSDASLMSSLGYLLALAGPVAVTAAVAVACVRRRRGGFVAAGVLLLVAGIGVLSGFLRGGTVAGVADSVLTGFRSYGTRILWAWVMAAGAALWVVAAWRFARRESRTVPSWRTPAMARRWGRVATIGAAVCPLPYGVIRMSWLTPWQIGVAGHADGAAVRVQGAMIGAGALIGFVLTIGLTARWGEVFPRWVPVLAGRPVPRLLAVVPATVVAVAACVASPGLIADGIEDGDSVLLSLLVFPFPAWGLLLGAATLGYWLRRPTTANPGQAAPARVASIHGVADRGPRGWSRRVARPEVVGSPG